MNVQDKHAVKAVDTMDVVKSELKLRQFIDRLMTGKPLTEEFVSHCSKSIFEFIKNDKDLKLIYSGMTLSTKYVNGVEKEHWIEFTGKRLTAGDLYYKLCNYCKPLPQKAPKKVEAIREQELLR